MDVDSLDASNCASPSIPTCILALGISNCSAYTDTYHMTSLGKTAGQRHLTLVQ